MLCYRTLITIGVALVLGGIPTSAAAQIPVRSVSDAGELHRELSPKDEISVLQVSGDVLTGRLVRLEAGNLEIRIPPSAGHPPGLFSLPLTNIRSIERRPDSSKNGALIGAGIGAGFALGMFSWAFASDRNEMDEWGKAYLVGGALTSGIGALLGWAIDAAHSKPRVRLELSAAPPRPGQSVRP